MQSSLEPKKYKVVNDEVVQLLEGPFVGIAYKYGKVELVPDEQNDILRVKFEYDIMNDQEPSDVQQFEIYIGHILYDLIMEQLQQNSIVYTGGVDEN